MKANDTLTPSRTDWDKLENMADEDIDYSDIPPLGDKFFQSAKLVVPAKKAHTLIQIDADILAWFKEQSHEYQTLINQTLRDHIQTHQR